MGKNEEEDENFGAKVKGCWSSFVQCFSNDELDVSYGATGYKSIMQKSLHFTHNARFKEILMEIAVKCSENTIGNFVNNIDDMRILFDSLSPAVLQFFENGFLSTQHTDKVRNADWLIKETSIVFENNSSIVNEFEANKIVKKERKKKGKKGKVQNRQVELKMLCLNWLFNT